MKFTRFIAAILAFALLLSTMGCNTISRSSMTYLGSDDPGSNVIGRGTHRSWAGLGVTGASYAQVYEDARLDAQRQAMRASGDSQPPVLYNIKAFRENRSWPQALAVALVVGGVLLIGFGSNQTETQDVYHNGQYSHEEEVTTENEGMIVFGSLALISAVLLAPLRVYDLWLIADHKPAE